MRLKGIFSVAGIGFSEREWQLLKSIFSIARHRTRSYNLLGPPLQGEVDILLVNGEDSKALAEWDSYHARKPQVPTVMVVDSPAAAALPYHIERPLRASRVLSVLDQVSIRELAFVPELIIDQQGELPGNIEEVLTHASLPTEYLYTALVVEDSLAVRTLIALELRLLGVRAELAESGEQALKLLRHNRYDLVVLDILLPDIDGYQLCRILKKDRARKATPVIMLTGKTSPLDRLRAKLAGCNSYLSKPVDPQTFKKTVSQYLWLINAPGRRRPAPPQELGPVTGLDVQRGLSQGEFLLHYQPIISTATEAIGGFEALVRWQHPEHGFVSPRNFIPLAEETGAIVPLGWWIVEEACAYLKALQACHHDAPNLFVNVNLSPRQFAQADLVARLGAILEATGLDAASLKLDLTEELFKGAAPDTLLKLRQLRERGIQCQLDNFDAGGYADLERLQRFPIAALKIDRAFISRVPDSRKHAAMVEKTIALAHRLGMEVTAMGVEMREQLAYLKALHCEYVQGFWFAQPVDGNRAISLVNPAVQDRPAPPPEPLPDFKP